MKKRIHDFIPEIKDLYTVTSDGEFYSDNIGKMKIRFTKSGYGIINFMTVSGKKKTLRVHRVVMKAFRPIEDDFKFEVNHIDGNKSNNKLKNLEWCTPSYNQKHAFKNGLQKPRRGEKSNFSKLSENDVKKVFELRKQGLTQKEIAKQIGCTRSNISYILSNKTWQV